LLSGIGTYYGIGGFAAAAEARATSIVGALDLDPPALAF
jgi:hypothetical protein